MQDVDKLGKGLEEEGGQDNVGAHIGDDGDAAQQETLHPGTDLGALEAGGGGTLLRLDQGREGLSNRVGGLDKGILDQLGFADLTVAVTALGTVGDLGAHLAGSREEQVDQQVDILGLEGGLQLLTGDTAEGLLLLLLT
eukprot:370304_1